MNNTPQTATITIEMDDGETHVMDVEDAEIWFGKISKDTQTGPCSGRPTGYMNVTFEAVVPEENYSKETGESD